MWLSHYLVPPTQSLRSLYKAVSATVPRRGSPVLRQLRTTRTMRKTRLVILPGVRSITQIGCLLLFLACPTIAFKGQEKRDVEPMCKFHELKYWWLPFDTGEGKNSTIPQKWTGFECQREDTDTTKGKDNATDSIQHSCDDNIISHGRVAIHGKDKNYNLETNIRRNKIWIIHSLPGSGNAEMPSKRIGPSERRTTGRKDIPQTIYKTERISQFTQERRVAFYKDQPSTTHRQSSFSAEQGGNSFRARTMIQNRLQQNRRVGSETQVVNERRRLISVFERRDESKSRRLPSRINVEFTVHFQNLERLVKQNDQSALEQSTLERQENKGRATLSLDRNNNSGKHSVNTFTRHYMNRREKKETHDSEERLLNYQRRVTSGKREIPERASSQQDIREQSEQSNKRVSALIGSDKRRKLNRIIRDNNSPQQNILRHLRSSTPVDCKENVQRSCSVYRNSKLHQEKSTIERRLEQKSSHLREKKRETSHQSAVTIIQRKTQEEQPRMDRRCESVISISNERSLCNRRRAVRSVDFPLDRRMEEANIQRNIGILENYRNRRIRSEILTEPRNEIRKNIPLVQTLLRQKSSPIRKESRETINRSRITIIQQKNSDQSRMDRRRESVTSTDNERSLSDRRRPVRSVDTLVFSLERKLTESDIQRDSRIGERDISRDNIPPLQNMLRRLSSHEQRENTQRSSFIRVQPKDSREQSKIDRRLERTMNHDNEQRLYTRRRLVQSFESRVFSLDRRMGMMNLRGRDTSRDNTSPIQQQSWLERRENILESPVTITKPHDSRKQSRSDRSLERINEEQRLSNRRAQRSVESREVSLDRRMGERADIRIHESDISREDVLPLQNILKRRSSSERRENIQRSLFIRIQPNDSRERSRTDRRLERAVYNDNEQRLSNRRSVRSVDSRAFSLDRRNGMVNIRGRDISRDNISPIQNTLQQRNSLNRRETILQSPFTIIRPMESREQYRTGRRLERVVCINDEQRLSNRRAERCVKTREVSHDRRMGQRNDIRIREIDISRENVLPLLNILRRRSSSERSETILRLAVTTTHPKEFEELSTRERMSKRAVYNPKQQRTPNNESTVRSAESRLISLVRSTAEPIFLRDNVMHNKDSTRTIRPEILADRRNEIRENNPSLQNKLQRQRTLSRLEGRETTQRLGVANIQIKSFEERSRTYRRLERVVVNDNKQRMAEHRRSAHSGESLILSLDRRMRETNIQRNIRINENYRTRRIRSEILIESRNENRMHIPLVQSMLRQKSSPERKESQETIHRSAITIILRKNSEEQSRMDRRHESPISTESERSKPDRRRPVRSVDSLAISHERKMSKSDIQRDSRIRERDISRENNYPLQNMVRRLSSFERREDTQRSSFIRVQPNDSRTRSRADRRLERAVYNDNEQCLSTVRTPVHSDESRVFSPDRKMRMMNIREDIRKHQRDISRDNISPIQNTLQQRNSLDRRENILQSPFTIIKSKKSRKQYQTDRRLERVACITDEQRLSNRRAERGVESRVFSLDRRMEQPNQRRDISRENALLLQNTLRRRSPSERRDIIQRSSLIVVQPKDSREQSRIDRRLERAVYNDNEQRLSSIRSVRSVDSRAFSLDRRIGTVNMRVEIRKHERDISRGNNSPIQQRSSLERREMILQSPVAVTNPQNFREQPRIGKSLERARNNDNEQRLSHRRRSERSVESRVFSLDRRTGMMNLREDISRRHGRDISRDNRSPVQNTLQRRSSLERRENILQSQLTVTTPKESRDQSRRDKRLERGLPTGKEQRLSDRKRSAGSVESRVFSLDKRMTENNLRRDNEFGKDHNRRVMLQKLRDSRNIIREDTYRQQNSLRQLSLPTPIERRETLHRSVFSIIMPADLEKKSRVEIRLKPAGSIDNEKHLSDKRLIRLVASRVFFLDRRTPEPRMDRKIERAMSIDNKPLLAALRTVRSRDFSLYRRMAESRLWRDTRIHEKDISREELFPRRLQTGVSPASFAQRSRDLKIDFDSVEISPETKFKTSSSRNKLNNVYTREDFSRFNKRYTQGRQEMLNQRSIPERNNVLRGQTERYLGQKPSNSRQRIGIAPSTARVSKYELHLSTVLDMFQNYDEVQIFNTPKSASSWNGKMISAIKKAVTGSDVEEGILMDSDLKYSQGLTHEGQIRELRPNSEIRGNDKGHLLQDFVLGSVIAGYFISSIHQKIRDYRNFICIF